VPRDQSRLAAIASVDVVGYSRLGIVAPGAFADLLAVGGNPLEDLRLLQDDGAHLALIVKDGAIVKNNLSR
jgi:imidazolonepropionase-like amidohydrolase